MKRLDSVVADLAALAASEATLDEFRREGFRAPRTSVSTTASCGGPTVRTPTARPSSGFRDRSSSSTPTDREWQTYLDHIRKRLYEVDGIIGYTMGGGPNHARMAGALRWFMPSQIKAFGVRDLAGAFDYLELDELQRKAVTDTIEMLKRRLSVATTG